jgi:hypothetical protein
MMTCPTTGGGKKKRPKKTSLMFIIIFIQFSLIDTRPLHGMADVCEKHNIKLLTYGTFVRIALPPLPPPVCTAFGTS